MKPIIAACAVLTGLLCAGEAFAVPDYGYVTNGGSNQVRVFDPANGGVLIRNIPVGAAPRDIVGVPARGKLYVSNSGAVPGTISIIDSERLEVVGTVTVPDSESLSGMSYCPLIEGITVAGRRTSTGMAALFLLDLNSETASLRGEGTWSVPATDCSMVAAGGGKTYFSVPGASPDGTLAVFSTSSDTVSPLSLPAGTAFPAGMDRAPDGTFVYVACRSLDSLEQRLLRIDTTTDAITVVAVSGGTGSYSTYDVSFRRDGGSPVRAYVVGTTDGSTTYTLDEYDAAAGTRISSVATGSPYYTVFYHGGIDEDKVYLGTDNAPTTNFQRWDTATSPPSGSQIIAGGSAPTSFAFMPAPADPLIYTVVPKGGPMSGGVTVRVEGHGFLSGAMVLFEGVSQPTVYVDSGTLLVTPSSLYSGGNTVTVQNPNLKTASLMSFYTGWVDSVPCEAPLPAPSISQGYAIRSVPRYACVGALRDALAAAMGPYNPAQYRVFFWRGGRYVELPEMAGGEHDLSGESFWIVSRGGGGASVSAVDVTSNASSMVVPLRPGWNMISLPFENIDGTPMQLAWSSVSVTSDGAQWLDAGPANASSSILYPEPFEFVGGGYVKPSILETGRGYFVLNRTGGVIYLLVSNGLAAKPRKLSKVSYAALRASDPVPPAPPGNLSGSSSGHSSGGGCGLLGAEALLLLGLCRMIRRRRAA